MSKKLSNAPRIVMIGGGTGSFTLLSSLKHYVKDITAIVNMTDDGGSTGTLRDELGVLPPGDIRQCLVALSDAPDILRELFNYRFPQGGTFGGHSFGNLFLTAVEKMSDDFAEAINIASEVLHVQGKVVPVTLDKTTLVMKDGKKTIRGEFIIGHRRLEGEGRPKLTLDPVATINPTAQEAIAEADIIVIAPGNLYGSLIPTLIVDGMAEALVKSKAKLVQVTNLVTKPGQTDGFEVEDFVAEFENYITPRKIDYVLYNNKKPPKTMITHYAASGELPVEFDKDKLKQADFEAVGEDFVSKKIFEQGSDDPISSTRTLIRHNAELVSKHIMRIFFS